MLEALTLAAEAAAGGDAAPLLSVASLVALLSLTALEVVLGIDNVVFIAILVGRLPEEKQARIRNLGLGLAMGLRILLLFGIFWVMKLTAPLFSVPFLSETAPDPETGEMAQRALRISGKDLILLGGGLFLIAKATYEMHHLVRGDHGSGVKRSAAASAGIVIAQILMLDLVFSLDSVITAVGMADHITIMVAAVVIAVGVMMAFAGPISRFVARHPSLKVLALAFLVLIGVLLVADGLHQHLDRGYVYFAMAFALCVDLLQMRADKGEPAAAPAAEA